MMIKEFILMLRNIRNFQSQGANLGQIKYLSQWKNSLRPNASSVVDEQPWITFKAMDFLKGNIDRQTKVFEYGGGGSTLFWLKYVSEVITVEHDEKWFEILSQIIAEKKIKSWKGNLILPDNKTYVENPIPSNPLHYSSKDQNSAGKNFYNYAAAIDQYPNKYFDVVLVDGRSRPSCMLHAIPKLKVNGYLILDNSNRDYYLAYFSDIIKINFVVEINGYGPCPYLPEFTQTTIWKKVKE